MNNKDYTASEDSVNVRTKKPIKIKKEDRRKLKKRRKQAIKLKKSRQKKSFLGFSGRLSLVFLVIVMIFTSTLYSFIYLNNRLELLRNEKAQTTQMLLSWETLNNATNRLLVRSGKREKIEAVELWKQLYKDFKPEILAFINKDSEEETQVKDEDLTMKKRINLFVDNTMNYVLNYIYKQRTILEDTYRAGLRTNRNTWFLVETYFDSINESLQKDKIINFIENVETSFSVEYGKRLVQGNIDEDFFNTIDSITGFYTISQQFATQLQYTIDLLDSDINLKSRFINILMAMMANIISVIAFVFTIVFFFYLRGSVIKPLNWLIRETERIGRGDLTGKIHIRRSDEIGTLTAAFNTTVTDLKTLIQQIYVAIIVITKTLRTLFKSSTDVKESANAQATTIENTRENFEKLDSMIKTISEETTKANNYTEEALNKAKIGLDSIADLEKEMTKIETSSEEITDIINLINYIAEQTELLSINASIEAARAGEYGKGFSVVANEIKQLAERSTQSANRIYELITYNSKIIQDGVNLSRSTAELLKEIAMSTEISAGIVKTINEESNKIHVSSNEILGVINYIAEVAQVNLLEIENVSNATVDLGEQSVKLQRFIGQFDARSQTIKDNQTHIEELLQNKLEITMDIIRTLGEDFLPTGNKVEIKTPDKRYIADELKLGENVIVTYNNDFVDNISERTNTSVSFFQNVNNEFVRVSTTIKNYDETRAIGTMIPQDSEVYHTIIDKESYYGRIFIVNRWYISIYEPVINRTGNIVGIINLAIPEEMDVMAEAPEEGTIKKERILTA